MAGYMVFIWDDEAAWANADPHTVESTMAAHDDFMARNAAALRGGSRCTPVTRRPRSGTALTAELPSATAHSPKPKR